MKSKSLLLMCVAVGCGLVSMLGVKQFMNKNKTQEAETVDVLVATQSIASGIMLDETNTEFKAYPIDSLVEGVVTTREQITERALKSSVYPGDFILEQKLGNKGDLGITSQIPPGMRAVTCKVDATTSHSGMMMPGHRVDVMCTYKVRSRDGMKSETKTVLQFIKVFATDNTHDAGSSDVQQSSSKNITLLVTPEEATKFLQAKDMSNNNLHLALRSNSDTEDTDSDELDDEWLVGTKDDIEEEEVAVAPEPVTAGPVDIRTQLSQELSGGVQVAMVEKEVKAVAGTWNIEIFEGENRRIETVEVPAEDAGNSDEDTASKWFDAEFETDIPASIEMNSETDGGNAMEPNLALPLDADSDLESEASIVEPAGEGDTNGIKGLLSKYFAGA